MSTATDMLAAYLAAETAILQGKELRFMDRWLRREDLEWVIKGRKEWESKVAAETTAAAGVTSFGSARYAVATFDGR